MRSSNPLGALLDGNEADRPTRAVFLGGLPTRGRAITQVKPEVG